MLNRLSALLLSVLLLAGLAVSPAQAQDRSAEVREMLQQRDREIKRLLGSKDTFTPQQREQLKEVVNQGIDFEAMGRQALGPHWQKLTAVQRKNFVNVFSEIVRAQSLSNLEVYRARVTYDAVAVKGDSAYVKTTTVYQDVPTRVDYVLGFADDTWRVHDIVLDEVSTADGYARSFQTVIRKRGFDALMTSLNQRLERMKSS